MDFDKDETWGRVEIADSLAGRKAGTSAAEQARELRAADPIGAVASRLLRKHSNERAWSKGATGERVAGYFLSKLGEDWHTVHDVPVGERGANIDHVVVGPGGVFTVNAKNVTGTVWLAPRTLLVNGHKTAYLPTARHEASRAGRYLTAAVGVEVVTTPVLAIIADGWDIKEQPDDVIVGSPKAVVKRLRRLPASLDPRSIAMIVGAALKPETWREKALRAGDTGSCPCGGRWVERTRRSDGNRFLGCSRYPGCRRTTSIA